MLNWTTRALAGRCAVAVSAALIAAPAVAQDSCDPISLLEDAAGDWSGSSIQLLEEQPGLGTPEQDLLGVTISQPDLGDGQVWLEFVLTTASMPAQLLPNASWYVSFLNDSQQYYGVRLQSDSSGVPSFFSYLVSGNIDETVFDGRFVEAGTERPAHPDSHYTPDGEIHIIVRAEDLGLFAPFGERVLGGFNSASVQYLDLVAAGATFTMDQMPDDLSRQGFYQLHEAGMCGSAAARSLSAAGSSAGGSFGGLALLGLFGAALARRRIRRG